MIGGGGESIKSDPKPDAEGTSLSSPLSVCCSEGLEYFLSPFPPCPITFVHYTPPEHAPYNNVDVDDIDDNNNADIRASVIQDVKRL